MKKLQKFSSLLLALVIAIAIIPVCFAEEADNPYPSIDLSESILNAKPATLNGGYNVIELDTARLALATAEVFMHGIEYDKDKTAMYTQCKNLSTSKPFSEFGWEQKSFNNSSVSNIDNSLEEIYEQLKNGIPVLVNRASVGNAFIVYPTILNQNFRTAEWALIVGYNGSKTKLESDNFMVVDISPSSTDYNYCTLSYWLGSSYVTDIAIRQDGVDFTSVWENDFEIKSVSHKIIDNEVVFTVTAPPNFNRVKVTYADELTSYISYSNEYTIDPEGKYVFTLSAPLITGVTEYAFDGRKSDTNRYAKNYFYKTVELDETEITPLIIDVSHEFLKGNVIFTVVTQPGNFDRIKLTTADALSGSLGIANTYTIDDNGNYVWTIKEPVPTEDTTYAFDVRNAETKKYYKEYSYYEVEPATPAIISTTHTISDAKIVFTIITKPGDFGRIKVTTADNLKGSLGIASKYTVNTDGNYVWTIKADAPTEHTSYAFDLRNANTGSYMKEYYYYTAEAKTPAILSVNHEIADNKIILTVTTKAGNYDRIKATLADNLGGSIAVATSYTIDADGNYVWTIKTNAPTEATDYAFDLRINGGRYIKDYYYYTV